MARTSKKEKAEEQNTPEVKNTETIQVNTEAEEQNTPEVKEIPANVEKLMQLYPQYEQIYITKDGFVHPVGAPQYLVADATLYTNKYFNNK